jgi:arylsulfatase A-like enzyme
MKRACLQRAVCTLLYLVLIAVPISAASRPDLIVVISIDQFRYEYIQRFAPWFSEGGFNRFIRSGANFTNGYYKHSTTFTGPGHATIGTGRTPSGSGIVGNWWFERETRTAEYCAQDERATVSAGGTTGMSPQNLASDSLGDRLLEKYPHSKVIGLAIKDRAAILMAGRRATAAYWFDPKVPGFISSSYYHFNRDVLSFDQSVPKFVREHPVWEASSLIPAADLTRLTYDPPELRKFKTDRAGMGVAFPHPVKDAAALTYTPFGNDLVLRFAEHVIRIEHLGTPDDAPDLLFVGLSSPDYLGHNFGPDSLEVADDAVRTDRSLQWFLEDLKKSFGSRATVVITADHGVQSIPEVARALGRDAGRMDLRNAEKSVKTIAGLVPQRRDRELSVAHDLGIPLTDSAPIASQLIAYFDEPAIYLNWPRVAETGADAERVKSVLRDRIEAMPGVASAYTNTQLLRENPSATPVEQAVRRSFRADRSGDIMIVLKEGWIWSYAPTGTNHGQPVELDQHVPMLFYGAGIIKGTYDERVAPSDIATTLGALVGVQAGDEANVPLRCVAPPPKEKGATTAASESNGLAAALAVALDAADPDHKAVIVAGEKLSPDARAATASAGRPTIDLKSVPQTSEASLPAGYLRIDSATLSGDEVSVRLWKGPIPKAKPGVILMDCGTGISFQLKRGSDGTWTIASRGISQC